MPLKLIHIGLGGWGSDWEANAIPPVSKDIERVAIVETFEPMLERAQKTLNLRDDQVFLTAEDAYANVEADAVLITAPLEAHMPLAIQAMQAGKHVLTEKPLAASLDEAVDAIEVSRQTGKILQVSQNYRFYPAPRKAAELIQTKAMGDLGSISLDFRKWGNEAEPGTIRHYEFVQPLLYDMSIHHFDLMRLVTGQEAVRVFAQASDPKWSHFVEPASASVMVEISEGTIVSYRGSWVSSDSDTMWAGDWRKIGRAHV